MAAGSLHEAQQRLTSGARATNSLLSAIMESKPVARHEQRAFTCGDDPRGAISRGFNLCERRRDSRRHFAVERHTTATDRRQVKTHTDASLASFKNGELTRTFVLAVAEWKRRRAEEVERCPPVGARMQNGDDVGDR